MWYILLFWLTIKLNIQRADNQIHYYSIDTLLQYWWGRNKTHWPLIYFLLFFVSICSFFFLIFEFFWICFNFLDFLDFLLFRLPLLYYSCCLSGRNNPRLDHTTVFGKLISFKCVLIWIFKCFCFSFLKCIGKLLYIFVVW